jgi:hypothetical protein
MMANEDFITLFKTYPNRNAELRMVSKQAYEFGKTVALEADSALSSGMHEHAILRQNSYLDYVDSMIDAIRARPIPDLPATHPVSFAINLSEVYNFFTTDVAGEQVPLNEQTQLLAEYWMLTAVELAKSQSAAIAGSLTEFDYLRSKNNIATMRKLLVEIVSRPVLDLPETSAPGSNLGKPSAVNITKK